MVDERRDEVATADELTSVHTRAIGEVQREDALEDGFGISVKWDEGLDGLLSNSGADADLPGPWINAVSSTTSIILMCTSREIRGDWRRPWATFILAPPDENLLLIQESPYVASTPKVLTAKSQVLLTNSGG